MSNIVLGVFSERVSAEDAISKLEAKGYNPKDMSILMKDKAEGKDLSSDTGASNVAEGAVSGAGTGAVVGGIAGLLAGTVLPGLGGFLIGGPIGAALGLTGAAASTVSGAATGALAGGIIGALTSTFGLSDEEAKTYETRINAGGILVAVPARVGQEEEVKAVMNQYGADNVKFVQNNDQKTQENSRSRSSDSSYQQPAYFNQIGRSGVKGGSEGKGWEGEPKRHSQAAKKGKAKSKAQYSQINRGNKKSKDSGKGWYGDSKRHAEAKKGK